MLQPNVNTSGTQNHNEKLLCFPRPHARKGRGCWPLSGFITDEERLRFPPPPSPIVAALPSNPSLCPSPPLSSAQYAGNAAEGKFDFQALLNRLQALRAKLDDETEGWRQKGRELTARRSYARGATRAHPSEPLPEFPRA